MTGLSQEKYAERLNGMTKKKYIHITREDRKFIMKALGVTERMVFKGIRFESDSDLAKKVRKLAMDRGGIVMIVIPEVETLHDHDNVTRQYFPNGALVELDRNDGTGYVIFNGKTVKTYKNVAVKEINGIHEYAAALR